MTEKPRLFGAPYSVYVRIARLVLAEKSVDYDLVPVDIFAAEGPPPGYIERHPFGRIPAFEHDGFALYETGAITRFIDTAFDGPALQPAGDSRTQARCNQLISIADNYAYPLLVWGLYVERISKPARGAATDETVIAATIPKAKTCLEAISSVMGPAPWLCGDRLSLADLYLAPMVDYVLMAPEGRDLLREFPKLANWWSAMSARPSMDMTRPA